MPDSRLLPPLAALRAFEAVGRLGGIRRAATEISVDHAVISRHIRSLETWLGVSLLVRHHNGNTLSAEGEIYHDEITRALNIITDATGKIIKRNSHYKLKIWSAPALASLWLSSHIGAFMSANPQILVDFRPTDETPDFRSKDVDCDIRYLRDWGDSNARKGLRTLEFARPNVFPVASAECLARLPRIETAQDMLGLPLLHEENDLEWLNWFTLHGVQPGASLPGPRLWQAHLSLNAARQGNGIALANDLLIGDDLASGRLVLVTPAVGTFQKVHFGGYTFIAREEQWNAPAIAEFRRWLQRISV